MAVIGGGCAALAAAWELSRKEHAGRFEVTVYQPGFRLGGKGASGRGPHDRIEEHGLHVWMGCYDNAFSILREVYDELGRDRGACPIATWRDAFLPHDLIGTAEPATRGEGWDLLTTLFPPLPGEPGDPLDAPASPFTVAGAMARAARVAVVALRQVLDARDDSGPVRERALRALSPAEAVLDGPGVVAAAEVVARQLELLDQVEAIPKGEEARADRARQSALQALDVLQPILGRALEGFSGRGALGDVLELVSAAAAALRGLLVGRIDQHPDGLDALNELDLAEWLERNGASVDAARQAVLRGFYSLAFAFEGGRPEDRRVAAGLGVRQIIRSFLTYRGSVFYAMRAGMGDVVFAPWYEALRRRGVRFEFFHRLERIRLSPPGEPPHVTALELVVEAKTRTGAPYAPLVFVRGLPCWPSTPDWAQLEDGERLARGSTPASAQLEGGERLAREASAFEQASKGGRPSPKTLRVREDFDFVVLGVGPGVVAEVAVEIVERDPRWRAMVEAMRTVATRSLQLWLRPSLEALGWRRGSVVTTGLGERFDTWADMTHLLPAETWPASAAPGSIAYFCNVLPDADLEAQRPEALGFEARATRAVEETARRFLDEEVSVYWPRAVGPDGKFRRELLLDQLVKANVHPSDRYALSLPGTIRHRISPLDPTYDNLTVCGDWTDCGLNLGCVEAAVMSGRLAAHALSGLPRLEDIPGYDGP